MPEDFNTILQEERAEQLNSLVNPEQGAIQTPYSDGDNTNLFIEQHQATHQPYSNGVIFTESVKHMFEDTTVGSVNRINAINKARAEAEDNEMLTAEEANAKYAQYGVHFNNPIRKQEAEVIAAQKIKEMAARERLSRSEGTFMSGVASLTGSMVGSLADPINIATLFIPVSKLIPALKGLEATGLMGRTLVRGADGVIMNSLVEPLPLYAASIDQRDYTMADSMFNLAAGGLFNAGMGALIDGVRGLAAGELFNSNVASAVELGNNRALDSLMEYNRKKHTVTSMAFDDLVNLGTNHVDVQNVAGGVAVKLKETGPLSRLSGYGKDVDTAIRDLRQQIGGLLDNDSIFKGYRVDDAIERMFRAINGAGFIGNGKAFAKWLNNIQSKALRKGMSFEDFLAGRTNNFTDFTKLLKQVEKSRSMQALLNNMSEDELDELAEAGAEAFDAMVMLKEAFNTNSRKGITFENYRASLNERMFDRYSTLDRHKELTTFLQNQQRELDELKNQLVMREENTNADILLKKKAELESSISLSQRDLDDLVRGKDIETWKAEADNIELLNRMREVLDSDPRTFEDVKALVEKQIAGGENHSWDTSDSILDDMTFAEEPFADEARMSKLEEETEMHSETLKILAKDFSKEELDFFGIDKDGKTPEMAQADIEIENMRQLQQDADAYAACRRGEIL